MISAIIPAAGRSTRMGRPKMLLRWGNVTVLEHVITVFGNAGIEDILIVTGGAREQVEEIILESSKHYPVRSVYNKAYMTGEMLASIQCGLRNLTKKNSGAAMIGLGDQPQVQEGSVKLLQEAFQQTNGPLIVPSFQKHRGHPWLIARPLWEDFMRMNPGETPRDFLNMHTKDIQYIDVDSPSILADLDTPEDYRAAHP